MKLRIDIQLYSARLLFLKEISSDHKKLSDLSHFFALRTFFLKLHISLLNARAVHLWVTDLFQYFQIWLHSPALELGLDELVSTNSPKTPPLLSFEPFQKPEI